MSLVHEQWLFLQQLAELIRRAGDSGFMLSAGELYRTAEQQALHVANGRSQSMNSQHLKRLAIDLNFFRESATGRAELVDDIELIAPLGRFWEGLDPANHWGGNWSDFKDVPHFERREASTSAPLAAPPARSGQGLLGAAVGQHAPNRRDDVETVQRLINLHQAQGSIPLETALKSDGIYGSKTLDAVLLCQQTLLDGSGTDGRVDPGGATLAALCRALPGELDRAWFGLLYLRAADDAIADFTDSLKACMAARQINTPLRQAHFLAQIGHESGELRFREEIASGSLYEGRRDLGNTQPGDGSRFKGRGLIQLTGRANYNAYGQSLGRAAELLAHPQRIASESWLCVDVAGWYWERRGLNTLADRDDLNAVTRRINGGLNGLEDRRRLLERARALFGLGR